MRFDGRTGAFLNAFVSAESGDRPSPAGWCLARMATSMSGSFRTNEILRFDGRTGAFLNVFVPAGSGGLSEPFGLMFGLDGHLYVSGFNANAILRYDGQTGIPLAAPGRIQCRFCLRQESRQG